MMTFVCSISNCGIIFSNEQLLKLTVKDKSQDFSKILFESPTKSLRATNETARSEFHWESGYMVNFSIVAALSPYDSL